MPPLGSSQHVAMVQTIHAEVDIESTYINRSIRQSPIAIYILLYCLFTIHTHPYKVNNSPSTNIINSYLFPATAPSFLPIASSSSIPAHMPLAKSVLPTYFNKPVFAPPTNTLSPTYTHGNEKCSHTGHTYVCMYACMYVCMYVYYVWYCMANI